MNAAFGAVPCGTRKRCFLKGRPACFSARFQGHQSHTPIRMVRYGLARYGVSRDRTLSGMPPVGRRVTPDLGMGT
jgi:hypothetical protein